MRRLFHKNRFVVNIHFTEFRRRVLKLNIFQDIETAPTPVEEKAMDPEVEQEVDRDSLVPGTGSINGHDDDDEDPESDIGEDLTEEDENMSNVVQGTTETILNKLEENLAQAPEIDESELLQARQERVVWS